MNLKEILGEVDWINVAQDGGASSGSYKHGNELSCSRKAEIS